MNGLHNEMPGKRPAAGAGWQYAMFRAWRERAHPRTAYLIGPHVSRPEFLDQTQGASTNAIRALKTWEPRVTGVAYSDRDVYLVEVVAKLTPEHIGRMLYLADLFRADADYIEHRSKRGHLVMLVREAPSSVLEFARRRRVRVVVLSSESAAESPYLPG